MAGFSSRSFAVTAFAVTAFAFGDSLPIEPVSAHVGSGGQHIEERDDYREEVEKWIKAAQNRRREEDAIVFAIVNFVLEEA